MSAAAPNRPSWLPRAVLLVAAAGLVGAFFAFGLHHTLTLESLHSHRDDLVRVRDRNPVLFGGGYLLAYILMAWAARRAGIPLRRIGARLFTSARKYERGGWAATTARHLWLTAAQAWPEWRRLRGGAR